MITKPTLVIPDIYPIIKSPSVDKALEDFDLLWRDGDRVIAGNVAKQFVESNREALTELLGGLNRKSLVEYVTSYRNTSRDKSRIITDMWLLSEFPPQSIRGYRG